MIIIIQSVCILVVIIGIWIVYRHRVPDVEKWARDYIVDELSAGVIALDEKNAGQTLLGLINDLLDTQ